MFNCEFAPLYSSRVFSSGVDLPIYTDSIAIISLLFDRHTEFFIHNYIEQDIDPIVKPSFDVLIC